MSPKPRYFHLLHRASRSVFATLSRASERELGVGVAQLTVLHLLASADSLRSGQIALALDVDEGATTRMLDRLVDKRVIERVDDPSDRRVRRLRITEAGRALAAKGASRLAEANARLTGTFTPEELDVVRRFLEHAIDAFSSDPDRNPRSEP